jgi:hypothetical protein
LREDEQVNIFMTTAPDIQELCEALRSKWYLTKYEIDSIIEKKEFFQPYLREALSKRAAVGTVPEYPIDATDCQAIFLLTDLGDESIIPDLLECLRMEEKDLDLIYADSLTEHLWVPIAKVGQNHLQQIWEFVTDESVFLFSRVAVITGVIAMHHFHPDRRAETVAFIERLLDRSDVFSEDYLANVLCDCADSGLDELKSRAMEFASQMDEYADPFCWATAEDILKAFQGGARSDLIPRRYRDVYAINREWQRWDEMNSKKDKEDDDDFTDGDDEWFDVEPVKSKQYKIGRNEPCPCGSGKKYKKCHGE